MNKLIVAFIFSSERIKYFQRKFSSSFIISIIISIKKKHFFLSELITAPTFTISQKGQCQLTHNGFKFKKDKYVKALNGMGWRCGFSFNKRYPCKMKATTYEKDGIQFALFRGVHKH